MTPPISVSYVRPCAFEIRAMSMDDVNKPVTPLKAKEYRIAEQKYKTFRFTFQEDTIHEINHFAKIHRYDDRKTFKCAWEKNEILKRMVHVEQAALIEQGYIGNVEDKMFKSTRYYYRKKKDEREEPQTRKQYIGFSEQILNVMDAHITIQINNHVVICENTQIIQISPATSYIDFCQTNKPEILKEIGLLKLKLTEIIPAEISIKFKKTYKNRYNKIREKNQNHKK